MTAKISAPFAAAGFRVKDKDAVLVEETVAELFHRLERPVTPDDLLEASASPTSPTHHLFEWDDAKAAHGYRLVQASYYIRSVKVETSGVETRAIMHVNVGEQNGYVPNADVLASQDLAEYVLQKAFGDLVTFSRRYALLKERIELKEVFRAIEVAVQSSAVH